MKVGIYLHDGFTFEPRSQCPFYWREDELKRLLDWYEANTIDIVQYWITPGAMRQPVTSELQQQFNRYRALAQMSKARGFELWWIIGTNIVWKGAPDAPLRGQLDYDLERDFLLDPKIPENFQRCTEWHHWVMQQFPEVDVWDIFAADWGGWTDGTCDVGWYKKFVENYLEYALASNSRACFCANTWSIGSWPNQPLSTPATMDSPQWRAFWDAEVSVCQDFVHKHLPHLPRELSVAFPCHNWYRGFTQQWYQQHELPNWPDRSTLESLQRPLCAWTHFIIENDPYHGNLWGRLSVRVRYIRQLAQQLNAAPFDVATGNVYSGRQAVNVFAWAQLLREPNLEAEDVFTRFAAEVVAAPYQDLLVQTLMLLENVDAWEDDLPHWSRLPKLEGVTLSREEAAKHWRNAGMSVFKQTPLLGISREVFFESLMQTLNDNSQH